VTLAVAGTPGAGEHGPTRDAVAALARADAVLLASPVYRASYPGVLKNLFDLVPLEALRGKPVGLVVVGATRDHYLGVDRHVRDVLAWFGALPLPVSVYLASADFDQGEPSAAARDELEELAATLLRFASSVDRHVGPVPLAARRP
jgi:FMN reductase